MNLDRNRWVFWELHSKISLQHSGQHSLTYRFTMRYLIDIQVKTNRDNILHLDIHYTFGYRFKATFSEITFHN